MSEPFTDHPAARILAEQLDLAGYRWRWLEGARWTALVDGAIWRPTGRDFAPFPDDADQLLQAFPDYPYVRVALEPPPSPPTAGLPTGALPQRLAQESARLSAEGDFLKGLGPWLVAAGAAVEAAVDALRREADFIRSGVVNSRYGDWHISGCNQHASTIRVHGRDIRLSCAEPAGHPADLSTVFLSPLIRGIWKADYRPHFTLESADYGSSRVKMKIGRRGRSMPTYWLDLRHWTISTSAQGLRAVEAPRRKA